VGTALTTTIKLLHNRFEFIDLNGFVNVFESTQIHRLQVRLHATIGRYHDDMRTRIEFAEFLQKSQSVHLRHIYIADHQVNLLYSEMVEGLLTIGNAAYVESLLAKQLA